MRRHILHLFFVFCIAAFSIIPFGCRTGGDETERVTHWLAALGARRRRKHLRCPERREGEDDRREGARRISGATYAISTTGIAGPSGGSDDKPVGTVCIGLATPEKVEARRLHFPFGQRSMNKSIFGMVALNMLRKELLKLA